MIHGKLVFASGQLGLIPATGQLAGKTAAEQAGQALDNLRAVLEAAGSSLGELIKTTIFLTDMATFPEVNAVYEAALGTNRPARSTVGVTSLPKGALVEIEGSSLTVRGVGIYTVIQLSGRSRSPARGG
jgi:2-iminobutanoate/2-iminopropanoate deaminase